LLVRSASPCKPAYFMIRKCKKFLLTPAVALSSPWHS
jgi:hypothetical protein